MRRMAGELFSRGALPTPHSNTHHSLPTPHSNTHRTPGMEHATHKAHTLQKARTFREKRSLFAPAPAAAPAAGREPGVTAAVFSNTRSNVEQQGEGGTGGVGKNRSPMTGLRFQADMRALHAVSDTDAFSDVRVPSAGIYAQGPSASRGSDTDTVKPVMTTRRKVRY